ncbi:MAG: divalent-cation tolerance protein CutA [Chloroflexi bacterium]|nr:divalent-cation tolerance protein CutA [Chloroflexota bacterium]
MEVDVIASFIGFKHAIEVTSINEYCDQFFQDLPLAGQDLCPLYHFPVIVLLVGLGLPDSFLLASKFGKAHSYTVPEVIALPIIGGNEDYLPWVDEEVRER